MSRPAAKIMVFTEWLDRRSERRRSSWLICRRYRRLIVVTELQIAIIAAFIGAVIGAILGVAIKIFVDRRVDAKNRRIVRSEDWLEDALNHADFVRDHIQSIRAEVSAPLGFDPDAISRAILRQLTNDDGPTRLGGASGYKGSTDLGAYVTKVNEAWMAVRFATMDDEHSASPAQEEHDPIYAVQWYETALWNFADAARKELGP